MEEIIRDIVEADNQARASVRDKKHERFNIQNLIQSQKDEIQKKYQEETRTCIAAKKAEMSEELNSEVKQEEKAYTEALEKLQEKYDAHKEHWVSEIMNQCLAS